MCGVQNSLDDVPFLVMVRPELIIGKKNLFVRLNTKFGKEMRDLGMFGDAVC